MPLVSVIIPVYNAAAFVLRALRSVFEQSHADLEIVVVDDGSTDETESIVASLPDQRLRYIWQPHRERSSARNAGIVASRGEVIAFLDADDWWCADKLEKQVALLGANPDTALVYCWLRQIGPRGEQLRLLTGGERDENPAGAFIFDRVLLGNIGGPGSSMLLRRGVFDTVGMFREDLCYAEDWEFCLRVAARFPIGFVPEPLAFYQVHGTHMPTKLARLHMAEASPAAIRSGLRFAGYSPDGQLSRTALGRVIWRSGLVAMGIGDYREGNRLMADALKVSPELARGTQPYVLESIGYFANSLYDTVTPLKEALFFVNDLFVHLDPSVLSLASGRRRALAWACAIHAFEGRVLGRHRNTRSAFWRALLLDATWCRNIGLLSTGVRSLLPRSSGLH